MHNYGVCPLPRKEQPPQQGVHSTTVSEAFSSKMQPTCSCYQYCAVCPGIRNIMMIGLALCLHLYEAAHTTSLIFGALFLQNSRTALHYACYWGDMELVAPLVEFEKEAKSGLISVRDRNGDTGLHIASKGGFKAIIKELLKAKADKNIQNRVSSSLLCL